MPRKCLLAEQHSTNWYLQNTPQLQYTRKTRENVDLNNKRYFQFSSLLYSSGNNIECLFLVTCFLNKHLVVSFITHVGLIWSTGQVQTKPRQSGSSQGSRLWDNVNHEPRGWWNREFGWYAIIIELSTKFRENFRIIWRRLLFSLRIYLVSKDCMSMINFVDNNSKCKRTSRHLLLGDTPSIGFLFQIFVATFIMSPAAARPRGWRCGCCQGGGGATDAVSASAPSGEPSLDCLNCSQHSLSFSF